MKKINIIYKKVNMMKSQIARFTIVFLIVQVSLAAYAIRCVDVLGGSSVLNVQGKIPDGIEPFNASPELIDYITKLVMESSWKRKPDLIPNFNHEIVDQTAKTLDKYIRSQTPSTVRLMVEEMLKIPGIEKFLQLGIVVGDPHNGNFGTEADPFIPGKRERNAYRAVDRDEMAVGVMALDFVRYMLILKANSPNGRMEPEFTRDLFEAYIDGLTRRKERKVPDFIAVVLKRTPDEIRAKVESYAKKRTRIEKERQTDDDVYDPSQKREDDEDVTELGLPNGKDGKFKKKLFDEDDGLFVEFRMRNLRPQFLDKVGFRLKNASKKDKLEFKQSIVKMISHALKSRLGDNVRLLDIAIPSREGGGSANMQRFIVSVEVKVDGRSYRAIVEFKENNERAGWEAYIESPLKDNAAARYSLAIQITSTQPGPLSGVPKYENTSFLMRVKGTEDIDPSDKQAHEQALFNTYMMGLLHGSQGREISLPYITTVVRNENEFRDAVTRVTESVTLNLLKESGTKY